jgi:hypothetical protein
MPNKTRTDRKISFPEESVDRSPVLQEALFGEVRKNLIRREKLELEPLANQDMTKPVDRQDDPSKPWYIIHV